MAASSLTFSSMLLRSGRVKTHRTPEVPDLVQEVRDLLNHHRGHWKAIAPSLGVSYSWLSKFARGRIENPGYAKLRHVLLSLRECPSITGMVSAKAKTNTVQPRRTKRPVPLEV